VSPGDDLPADRRVPHPDRLASSAPGYAEIVGRHERALAQGEAGYEDPATGLFVMTAATLWARGSCCGSGCRHCPYVG
jgi:hypothetical protein